jgi:hypothetical protein
VLPYEDRQVRVQKRKPCGGELVSDREGRSMAEVKVRVNQWDHFYHGRQRVPPKHWYLFTSVQSDTSQKTVNFIPGVMRISDLKCWHHLNQNH